MIRFMPVHRFKRTVICITCACMASACGNAPVNTIEQPVSAPPSALQPREPTPTPTQTILPIIVNERDAQPALFGVEVIARHPHDPAAFTQGLIVSGTSFLESTGLYGRSSLREVDITSGRVLRKRDISEGYFAEGLARIGDRLYQLTWLNNTGFVYDLNFSQVQTWTYATEGWGLTSDGARLIMSDGSSRLYALDPLTLAVEHVITVTRQGQPVTQLNELEWIEGNIYANIWQTAEIVIIDPASGQVTGSVDLSKLHGMLPADQPIDVLNGIAYDPLTQRLWVTGKLWPEVFQIRLVPR